MIHRPHLAATVSRALDRSPIAMLVGPRQCGKTTLASQVSRSRRPVARFDLENPLDVEALREPLTALESLRGLVILDEIQRRPDLFPVLRVLADRRPTKTRFLVLGSASPLLLRQGSESLAGRVEIIEMGGFDLSEVGAGRMRSLWLRGGFPRSFLAKSADASSAWRDNMIQTFLERDLPQLGLNLPALMLRRFWTMVAHHHGQTWNASQIGQSLGVSDVTTRRYLDVLTGAYVVRQIVPLFENLAKRQVKAPKIYVRDSGLLHSLLRVGGMRDLLAHPKCGASWEGFALELVLQALQPSDAWFWAVHGQAEIDLVVPIRQKRVGFEFKLSDAPILTRSMTTARKDLGLASVWVVYPGGRQYELGPGIQALPVAAVADPAFARQVAG